MITQELLERLAGLSRLGLSPEEKQALCGELESLLVHFQSIQDVDTDGIEPMAHVLTAAGVPAPDVVEAFPDPRNVLVPLSANHREGFFVVPRVVEGPERPERSEDTAEDS